MGENEGMTERSRRWAATVAANFEAKTGRTLEEWTAIARTCPETAPGRRKAWLKEHHGLGVNHASFVLARAFPADGPGWDDPDGLRAGLWKDPSSLAILEAIEAAAAPLEDVVTGQRKGFTSWSRKVQFAAARPLKGGRALLGLKLDPGASARLSATVRKESWSPQLTAFLEFDRPKQVDAEAAALIAQAAERG